MRYPMGRKHGSKAITTKLVGIYSKLLRAMQDMITTLRSLIHD